MVQRFLSTTDIQKLRKLCRKKSLRFLLYSVYKIRQKYQKMPSCAVKGCESSSEDSSGGHSIIFYSIPEDLALRKQWANFCCNSASQDLTICSLHFEPCELENSESKNNVTPSVIHTIKKPKGPDFTRPFLTKKIPRTVAGLEMGSISELQNNPLLAPSSLGYQKIFTEYKGNKSRVFVTAKRRKTGPIGPTVNLSFDHLPTVYQESHEFAKNGPKFAILPTLNTSPVNSSAFKSSHPVPEISLEERTKCQSRKSQSHIKSIALSAAIAVENENRPTFSHLNSALIVEPVSSQKNNVDRVGRIFREVAEPPWTFVETNNSFKLCRVDHIDEYDLTTLGLVVSFDKLSREVSVTSRGEDLRASCFSPKDFEFSTNTLKTDEKNIFNFLKSIKRTPLKWNPFDLLNSAKKTIKSVLKSVQINNQITSSSKPTPAELEKERVVNYFPALKMVHDQLQALTSPNPWIEDFVEIASEIRSLSSACYSFLRSTKTLLLPPERSLKKLKSPSQKLTYMKRKQTDVGKSSTSVIPSMCLQSDSTIKTIFVSHDPLLISNLQPIIVEDGSDSLQGIIFNGENVEEVVSECCVFSQVTPDSSLKPISVNKSSEEIIYSLVDQEVQLVDSSCISHPEISSRSELEVGVELLESWVETN